MTETTHYVTYYVAPQQKMGSNRIGSGQFGTSYTTGSENQMARASLLEAHQKETVANFVRDHHPNAVQIEIFVESPDTKRASKWPELDRAIKACKQSGALLVIAELGTLTNNHSFTELLIISDVKFHCCDQPFVNKTILEALSKHAEVQKKLHGKLIREGLKMTTAKSGNPNAAEVISKVNKPKIDTAIVFAFLLQPIIQDYRNKGYSQRQMVKCLNEEGFTAPEGGKWVLSQLQKVLDRVRLNEIAMEHKPILESYLQDGKTIKEIAEYFNSQGIPALKRNGWDEAQIKKLEERILQVQDIVLINRFVLDLLPLLQEFRRRSLSAHDILQALHRAGMPVRQDEVALTA